VQIYDAGEVDGYYYIALEFIEGGTLADRMARAQGPMQADEVVGLVAQVAAGLDYAHKLGFVHRDIKPGNVLLARDGRALVSDFGIAKLAASDTTKITQTGLTVGTPAFMSPEQARGEANVDRRSDIYSLGVTAYAMLTGTLPFQGDSPLSVLRKVIEAPPPPPESLNPAVPPGMAYALMRVLAKDPAARYATAGEFARALTRGREWMPQPADYDAISTLFMPFQPPQAPAAAHPRSGMWAFAAGLASIVLVAVLVWVSANALHLEGHPSPTSPSPTPPIPTASPALATNTPFVPTSTPT
jgi:serine/threonine-protein kinase